MGRLRYLILGPLEIRDGDKEMPLRGGQQRKLLAILLLHRGEAVSSDRLIEELWDGKPPDTAAKALQGYVSSLRKQLGPEAVETVGAAGYRMQVTAEDVDARHFEDLLAAARPLDLAPAAEKLGEALALWRGSALADFAYDGFAQREIERLEDFRLTATERRIDIELALGHHVDLVPELEALVRVHPLDERLRGHLMVALYRSGRQADALEAYSEARTDLLDELGLEPSEDLQALQRKILAHDESLAAPPRAEPTVPARVDLRFNRPLATVVVGLAILGATVAAVILTRGSSAAIVVPPDSVARIDPAGKKVESYAGVGSTPVAVAVGAGGVWVANAGDETVSRLDPATGIFRRNIGVGADVSDIAVGFGSVWVADGNDGTVTRIDPGLNGPATVIPQAAPPAIAPTPVFFVAVGSGFVWATQGEELLRINPRTNKVDRRLNVGTPTGLTTGGGSVWVTTESEQLLRIDPSAPQKTDAQTFSGSGPAIDPVYVDGSLWLIYQGRIEQIDPASLGTGAIVDAVRQPRSLATAEGTLWALDYRGDLSRLTQAQNGRVTSSSPLHVGRNPTAVAVGYGAAWVAVSARG